MPAKPVRIGHTRKEVQVGGIMYDNELKTVSEAAVNNTAGSVPVCLNGKCVGQADNFRCGRKGAWFTVRARLELSKAVAGRLARKELKAQAVGCRKRKVVLRVELSASGKGEAKGLRAKR